MAGGFKNFGPTYNSTGHVRLGYEGFINGAHDISAALITANANAVSNEPALELAGKFAAIGADGVTLAGAGGEKAVGLFREDLQDMVNASHKASFYFRGGEYYVNAKRTAHLAGAGLAVGDSITSDASGKLKKASTNDKVLGVVTHIGEYRAGNMYEKATQGVTDTDIFIGFIMYV